MKFEDLPDRPFSVEVLYRNTKSEMIRCKWARFDGQWFWDEETKNVIPLAQIVEWSDAPVALFVSASVLHLKRNKVYDINHVTTILDYSDGRPSRHVSDGEVLKYHFGEVTFQKSTRNPSNEIGIYESVDPGVDMTFARPLSEFTPDRFRIISRGL